MESNRVKKLNKLLTVEVSKALQDEVSLAGDVFVTVVGTRMSPTLEHATIFISVLPSEKGDQVLKSITRRIFFIQQVLNKRLNLRTVPKIRFEMDSTEERAARIEEILEKDNI